jgi:hypothetical protein
VATAAADRLSLRAAPGDGCERPLVILKREVENVAVRRLLVAKYEAVARYGYANIEHEPRFPDLGFAREASGAFFNGIRLSAMILVD